MAKPLGTEFARFCIPVLQTLKDMGGTGNASEVVDAVLARLKIPEAEQEVVNKNGLSRVENQIQWAKFYMSRAGYVDSPSRGVWTLTQKGKELDLATFDYSAAIRSVRSEVAAMRKARPEPEVLEDDSGEEVLDELGYRLELLRTLKAIPPSAFERFCQRLLREGGFQQVNVTGRSGDGGIDGNCILAVNPLVSFYVVFQCKRYAGVVTPAQVREFRGAMGGKTDKGIIITTGTFTLEAKKESRKDGVSPIELVDGDKLIEMCESLGLGLIPRKTFTLDAKFFEDFKK